MAPDAGVFQSQLITTYLARSRHPLSTTCTRSGRCDHHPPHTSGLSCGGGGIEGGGHIRCRSELLPLLESVLGHFDLPVLVAGGIGDGRAFAEVLAAGAAGARAGTRFVATNESGAHPAYKQAVAGATAGSTEITGAFSVCPLCATEPRARVLRSCIDALGDLPGDTVGEATVGGERISLPKGHGLPPGATATGHISAMPMYAGESAAAVHAVEPVAEVVKSWCATADEPS